MSYEEHVQIIMCLLHVYMEFWPKALSTLAPLSFIRRSHLAVQTSKKVETVVLAVNVQLLELKAFAQLKFNSVIVRC